MDPFSYIEISQKNLIHNIHRFKKYLHPDVHVAGVIKGNAYGHGLTEIAYLADNEVDYFQIDDYEELKALRSVSKKNALILGYIPPDVLPDVLNDPCVSFALYDVEDLLYIEKVAAKKGKIAHVHLMLDAYLGREGILLSALPSFLTELKKFPHITIDGVYAHFANIEDTSDAAHAKKQITAFKQALDIMKVSGLSDFSTHIAATSGILVYERNFLHNSLVRLGIGMYGLWPSENLHMEYNSQIVLKPVLRCISHIAQIKIVPAHYSIGYGLTYITTTQTTIAVIPQGYSDGYDRGLSNKGEVLIQGKRCRVLGRVSMNMFVVDVSHVQGVRKFDEVVLLGCQENEIISAEEIALHLDTINYEVMTNLSPLLPRVII